MRKVIRFSQVRERTGLSRATVWRREKDGSFPGRVRLNPDSNHSPVGWFEDEIEQWIDSLERGGGTTPPGPKSRQGGSEQAAELAQWRQVFGCPGEAQAAE